MARGSSKGQTPTQAAAPARLASLDAFRGFVILTMIFVNYCSGMSGIPWWMEHAPADMDGYSYVDVVFPGFLFIVGVAIPLSLQKRIARGDSRWGLLFRIIPRALSLMFLGTIFVSKENYSSEATGMPSYLWDFIFYLSMMVLWRVEPSPKGRGEGEGKVARSAVSKILRIAAFAALAIIVVIFRQNLEDGAGTAWLRTSWWGILGMIGWAYLASSIAYLLTKGSQTALMGILGFMIALYIGEMHGSLWDWVNGIENFLGVGGLFSAHAALVVAGVLVGNLLVTEASHGTRLRFMFWLGLGLYTAGQLIRPLHKISKIGGTDAYVLVTAGECALLLLLFYWLMDVKGWTKWADFLVPVGVNPLLAYILPDFFNSVLSIIEKTGLRLWGFFWPLLEGGGWSAVGNAAIMTAIMLGLTGILTRKKLILKL